MQKPNETTEQQAVIQWAAWAQNRYPALKNLYHVPNEGKRSAVTGQILKNAGLKPGVPDLILDYPAGTYHGLRIEMKFGKNKPTPNQLDWLLRLRDAGYFVALCWSADDAIKLLEKYVQLKSDEYMVVDLYTQYSEKWGIPSLRGGK